MVSLSVVACFVLVAVASATNVKQCPGRSIAGLTDDVQLISCKKLPCRLKKGTNQSIVIKFKPENDVKDIKNNVNAVVFGVPLPFIGVDGSSICDKIENESGEKVSCPLTGGQTYVYKDSFPILQLYPNIETKVHWSLQTNNKDLTCFEVPAKIVS